MRVEAGLFGEVESLHLPPVDQSLLLKIASNGRVKAIEKINTPLNEHSIPDPIKYLDHLSMTLDSSYVPPKAKNVHHLVYPRQSYASYGPDSIQSRYRETPSLMIDFQVQLHNYGHWVMNPPKMPSLEVMKQVVDEQDQVNRLFKIVRSIITAQRWLGSMGNEGTQMYRTAEQYVAIHEPTEAMFYDALDEAEDGVFGIMPDREKLSNMGLVSAARQLGMRAAARSLSLHREAQTKVRTIDIDDEPLLRAA